MNVLMKVVRHALFFAGAGALLMTGVKAVDWAVPDPERAMRIKIEGQCVDTELLKEGVDALLGERSDKFML